MKRAKISSDKMLEMANVFGKLTRRKTQFSNTKDYSQNAGTSIVRSILYSINVVETAFFDQHKIQNEVLSLQTALSNFSAIFDDRFSIINKQVEALQEVPTSTPRFTQNLNASKACNKIKKRKEQDISPQLSQIVTEINLKGGLLLLLATQNESLSLQQSKYVKS